MSEEFEKIRYEKNTFDDMFSHKNQELLQSQKSVKHLKKKNESQEKVNEQLENENKNLVNQVNHSQEVIEEKEIRINQTITANKKLYSQIMETKVKAKSSSVT